MLLALVPTAFLFGEVMGPPPQVTKLTTDTEIQAIVAEDLGKLPAVDRLFVRYVWIASGEPEDFQATMLVANLVSRASVVYPLSRASVIRGQLIRIDLRALAPRSDDGVNDLQDFANAWEELRFDPTFNKLLTANAIRNLIADGIAVPCVVIGDDGKLSVSDDGRVEVRCRPYKHNGATFSTRWASVVRLIPEHQDAKVVASIELMTGSEAAIVDHRYFITRAMTSIKGKGVFKDLWSGLYLDLSGIKTAKQAGKKNVTDEDVLFDSLGVGANADNVFDGLRSDQRTATLYSGVTGRMRRTDLGPTKSTAPNIAQAIFATTHDISTLDVDLDSDPFANLIKFTDTARETFFTKRNGLQAGVLFDGKGNLQEVAPQNVVSDSTIPHPYAQDLQPFISCLRCHYMDGSGGWKPLTNDVPQLVRFGLSVLDDRTRKGRSQADTIDRIQGLYAGTPEKDRAVQKVLRRAREDTQEAIQSVTGPWKDDKDRSDPGKHAANAVARIFSEYNYERVDASRALEDMGYRVSGKATKTFATFVPPDVSTLEDYRIGVLRADRTLGRVEWSLVQGYATERARRTERKAKQ